MTRQNGLGIIYLNAFRRDSKSRSGEAPEFMAKYAFEEMANKRRDFRAPQRTTPSKKRKKHKKDEQDEVQASRQQ